MNEAAERFLLQAFETGYDEGWGQPRHLDAHELAQIEAEQLRAAYLRDFEPFYTPGDFGG